MSPNRGYIFTGHTAPHSRQQHILISGGVCKKDDETKCSSYGNT
jgi:hypothetical protein